MNYGLASWNFLTQYVLPIQVMNAWSKCGKLDRAERVLEEMEMSYYDKRSEVRIAPNVVSYTTLMNG